MPDPGPPDTSKASAHWHAIVASLTCRGFQGKPMFPNMIFGPEVAASSPAAAQAAVIEELVRRTVEQDEN